MDEQYVYVSFELHGEEHSIPVDRKLVERLVQEEVWAQTLWPETEVSLLSLLWNYLEGRG